MLFQSGFVSLSCYWHISGMCMERRLLSPESKNCFHWNVIYAMIPYNSGNASHLG